MSHNYLLVEHRSDLNVVINQPLQLTQRIKFTCFDVSDSYIVFGATSGGLYIFKRYPCRFVKLIPSKEGSVALVSISSDEKNIVIASAKGIIVIIKDVIVENTVQYQPYNEHEGTLITAIKWHFNEVYIGTSIGKVSFISVTNALTKAIFHAPCAHLMHLDSTIVQIDTFSNFLLVSTQTRSYLCDTEKEQYRQIGKKQRDGNFGACFYVNKQAIKAQEAPLLKNKRFFRSLKDDERLTLQNNSDVKIFCARPGVRLWEANFDASVANTHQFRNTLNQPPSNVIHLTESADSHLQLEDFSKTSYKIPDNFIFGKIFVLADKFILSFNSKGFYIFDPETVSLVFWQHSFQNIKEVKVIKNFVYLYTDDNLVTIFSLQNLQNLVLKTLINKQYYICCELCIQYQEEIKKLIPVSDKIHLITILKEKLLELGAEDLLEKLKPILNAVQEHSTQKYTGEKLHTGIVLVQNVTSVKKDVLNDFGTKSEISSNSKYENDQNLPETLQALKEISATVTDKLTESTRNLKEKWQILEVTVKNLTTSDEKNKINEIIDVEQNVATKSHTEDSYAEPAQVLDETEILKLVQKQFQVSKLNRHIEVTKFYNILESKDIEGAVDLFSNFIKYAQSHNLQKEEVETWCNKQFLKYLDKKQFAKEIDTREVGSQAIDFLIRAFRNVNYSPEFSCSCSYPVPTAKNKKPEFYDMGCSMMKKLWNSDNHELAKIIYTEIPYMWKYVIKNLRRKEDINILLPLIIQYGEEELTLCFIRKFTYDTWDDAVKLLIKLKKMICLNCDCKFVQIFETVTWTSFGSLMVQSLGGPSAIKLLMRYATHIPSNELDNNFYQHCIFATAVDQVNIDLKDKAANFTKSIRTSEESSTQFSEMLAKFLHSNYLKKSTLKVANKNSNLALSKCSICDLPLTISLLGDNINLGCGHVSHKICFKHNENICKICKEVLM